MMTVASVKCPKCGLVQLNGSVCGSCGAQFTGQDKKTGTLQGSSANENYANPSRPASSAGGASTSSTSSLRTACAHCGKQFSRDEMIQYDGHSICAPCKPLFLQKIKEGQTPLANLVYAGFWIRFGAKFIDGLVLLFAGKLVEAILNPFLGLTPVPQGQPPDMKIIIDNFVKSIPVLLVNMSIGIAYVTWFIGKYQATPGKKAFGLKVVMPDGGRVSYKRAFGRYFGEMLSSFTMLIGYMMAAFDEQKRALHDRVCNTRVVRK